jgi:phenylalanyl-tRNA synthetase beta chain
MRLSLNWLKDFVDVTLPAAEVAERLTLAGLEVEGVEKVRPDWSGVVVGRVTRVTAHPQADRLKVAEVTDGRASYQVVCGAPNLAAGRVYPFAPTGATLTEGRKLKAAKLRGVESQGMLLAEDELGLSEDHAGLMEIPQDLTPGRDLVQALDLEDEVLEVAITPNRPDCLSILGLAREVAALVEVPLKPPQIKVAEDREMVGDLTRVTIQAPEHCPRYAARLVVDLTVQPSPFWLRWRLKLMGVRAINNLVDVTNYVLMEYGQPLHAFDFERLNGGRIVVRLPGPREERFTTLDGQERSLEGETLLICDAREAVALAGIMGGLSSEVTQDTRQVLIESAYFTPTTIRRTAKRLGLSTEASYRFERGVDPEGVITALERAAQLMGELGQGRVLAGRIDQYPRPIDRPRLHLRVSRANAILGTKFSRERAAHLLTRLNLPVKPEGRDVLEVAVPSFRGDLTREIDLIEELARLGGYGEIPVTLPRGELATPRPARMVTLGREAKQLLLGLGFFEVVTYSFQSERQGALLEPDAAGQGLRLANPLSEEQAIMRPSLLPGLLEVLRRNALKQAPDLRIFELSKVFHPQSGSDLPREEHWLAGLMCGAREGLSVTGQNPWQVQREAVDFFDLKGAVETLLEGLLAPQISFRPEGLPPFIQVGAAVFSGDTELGFLGRLIPEVGDSLDLEAPIWVFYLSFDALARVAEPHHCFTPLPRYPAVFRDLALMLPEEVPAAQVIAALYRHGRPLLEEARLFDVYAGDQVPEGKRSLAFRLTYRKPERTLTDEVVNRRHQTLLAALEKELGAQLR